MNKPDTKAKAKRKRHKQNKKKQQPKANQTNAVATTPVDEAADNDSTGTDPVLVHANHQSADDDGKL